VLGVPDLVMIHHIIPVGWPAMDRRPGTRRPLEEVVHYDRYDMSKYMSKLRGLTRRGYHDEPKKPGG